MEGRGAREAEPLLELRGDKAPRRRAQGACVQGFRV